MVACGDAGRAKLATHVLLAYPRVRATTRVAPTVTRTVARMVAGTVARTRQNAGTVGATLVVARMASLTR